MPSHLRLICNDWAIGKKWHAKISKTSRFSTIELSRQLYFWSLRTHLNRPHFHIVADFCWCSQMSKFLRCASRKFFYFCKSQIRKFLKNSAQLCLLTLNAEIRLWIHFLFTNLNWGILYYIFKRELIVSLDNVSTQAGKMYTLK
jgi:hypothetical protein